jgi:hypothetical protein
MGKTTWAFNNSPVGDERQYIRLDNVTFVTGCFIQKFKQSGNVILNCDKLTGFYGNI